MMSAVALNSTVWPGTAIIVPAIAGGLIVCRLYWAKIKSFFSGAKRELSDKDSTEEGDSN